MRVVSLLLWSAATAWSQGVVAPIDKLRFQAVNPVPIGSLMDQARKAEEKIKGKVYRYRAFVKPDADVGLLNLVLRAPVLSIVRVAALPEKEQKIAVEAVTSGGQNPGGLAFISGQGVNKTGNITDMKPLATEAFDNIDKALKGIHAEPAEVVAVTCYLSSLADVVQVRQLATARYPKSANTHVQVPIPYGRALVECEAVARTRTPVGYEYPEGLTRSPNFTQVVGIGPRNMVWSGVHSAAQCNAEGVRKMFAGLAATLKKNGADIKDVAFSYVYPTTQEATELSRGLRFEFYNKEKAPASTLIPFNGVADKGACTAVEVAAPAR